MHPILRTFQNNVGTYGINNSGKIVGAANGRAFIYAGGTILDLNKLVPTNGFSAQIFLNEARGINDSGQVIANGIDNAFFGNTGDHAYLLTPVIPNNLLPPILPYINSSMPGKFPPALQKATLGGGQFGFTWDAPNTFPAVSYQVQYKTNLAQSDWINVGGVQTTTGFTNTVGTDPQRFYHVLMVQ